jgi:hypothetical protein
VEHCSFGRRVIFSLHRDIPQRPRLATVCYGVEFEVPTLQYSKRAATVSFAQTVCIQPSPTHLTVLRSTLMIR